MIIYLVSRIFAVIGSFAGQILDQKSWISISICSLFQIRYLEIRPESWYSQQVSNEHCRGELEKPRDFQCLCLRELASLLLCDWIANLFSFAVEKCKTIPEKYIAHSHPIIPRRDDTRKQHKKPQITPYFHSNTTYLMLSQF